MTGDRNGMINPASTLFTEAFHPSPRLRMIKSEGEASSPDSRSPGSRILEKQ